MPARGVGRFASPRFGIVEATEIHGLIAAGQRDAADAMLRHLVHTGVAPSELWETAMTLAVRQHDQPTPGP